MTAHTTPEISPVKARILQNAILNNTGYASIATDEKGVIQIFNAGAERMLGYTGAEVAGKLTLAGLVDPLEASRLEAVVLNASRGSEDSHEFTFIRQDGSGLAAVACVTALCGAKGAIIGYLLIAIDNTAGRESTAQLRRAEQGFRLTVESVSDCAIVQLDVLGQVLSWNAGAQVLDGYRAREILGQNFARFYSREDIERGVPQSDLDAAAAAGRYETQGRRTRADGSTYRANIVLTAVYDDAGVLRGFARLVRPLVRDSSEPEPPNAGAGFDLAPRAASSASPCRLLYVEDDPASGELVEQLLVRRTDVLLLRAADADRAIALARTVRPDVVLLNIDMPGIGAVPFMQRLRADPVTQATPILALGANATPGAIAKALEAGFFYYLIKPMKAEPFMEALGEALEFAALERAEENRLLSK